MAIKWDEWTPTPPPGGGGQQAYQNYANSYGGEMLGVGTGVPDLGPMAIPDDSQGFIGDTVDALQGGAIGLAGSLAGGIPQLIGRGIQSMGDPGDQRISGVEAAGQFVAETGEDISAFFDEWAEKNAGEMSKRGQEALGKRWLTSGPDAAWKDPYAFWLQLMQTAPSAVGTMGPAVLAARGGLKAGAARSILKSDEWGPDYKAAAGQFLEESAKGATTRAAIAGGATESAMTMGGVSSEISSRVDGTSEEDLLNIPGAAELKEQYGFTSDELRDALKMSLIPKSALASGAWSAAGGAVSGGIMQKLMQPGADRVLMRFGKGWATEAVQEGLQGGGEAAVVEGALTGDSFTHEVAERALQEGILGGFFGGAMSAFRGSAEEAAAKETNPAKDRTEQPQAAAQVEDIPAGDFGPFRPGLVGPQRPMDGLMTGPAFDLAPGEMGPPTTGHMQDMFGGPLQYPPESALQEPWTSFEQQEEARRAEADQLGAIPTESEATPEDTRQFTDEQLAAMLRPESPKDIVAQIEHMWDARTDKDAVYISESTLQDPAIRKALESLQLGQSGFQIGQTTTDKGVVTDQSEAVTLDTGSKQTVEPEFFIIPDEAGGMLITTSRKTAKDYSTDPETGQHGFERAAGRDAPQGSMYTDTQSTRTVPYDDDAIAKALKYDKPKSKVDLANAVVVTKRDVVNNTVLEEQVVNADDAGRVAKKMRKDIQPGQEVEINTEPPRMSGPLPEQQQAQQMEMGLYPSMPLMLEGPPGSIQPPQPDPYGGVPIQQVGPQPHKPIPRSQQLEFGPEARHEWPEVPRPDTAVPEREPQVDTPAEQKRRRRRARKSALPETPEVIALPDESVSDLDRELAEELRASQRRDREAERKDREHEAERDEARRRHREGKETLSQLEAPLEAVPTGVTTTIKETGVEVPTVSQQPIQTDLFAEGGEEVVAHAEKAEAQRKEARERGPKTEAALKRVEAAKKARTQARRKLTVAKKKAEGRETPEVTAAAKAVRKAEGAHKRAETHARKVSKVPRGEKAVKDMADHLETLAGKEEMTTQEGVALIRKLHNVMGWVDRVDALPAVYSRIRDPIQAINRAVRLRRIDPELGVFLVDRMLLSVPEALAVDKSVAKLAERYRHLDRAAIVATQRIRDKDDPFELAHARYLFNQYAKGRVGTSDLFGYKPKDEHTLDQPSSLKGFERMQESAEKVGRGVDMMGMHAHLKRAYKAIAQMISKSPDTVRRPPTEEELKAHEATPLGEILPESQWDTASGITARVPIEQIHFDFGGKTSPFRDDPGTTFKEFETKKAQAGIRRNVERDLTRFIREEVSRLRKKLPPETATNAKVREGILLQLAGYRNAAKRLADKRVKQYGESQAAAESNLPSREEAKWKAAYDAADPQSRAQMMLEAMAEHLPQINLGTPFIESRQDFGDLSGAAISWVQGLSPAQLREAAEGDMDIPTHFEDSSTDIENAVQNRYNRMRKQGVAAVFEQEALQRLRSLSRSSVFGMNNVQDALDKLPEGEHLTTSQIAEMMTEGHKAILEQFKKRAALQITHKHKDVTKPFANKKFFDWELPLIEIMREEVAVQHLRVKKDIPLLRARAIIRAYNAELTGNKKLAKKPDRDQAAAIIDGMGSEAQDVIDTLKGRKDEDLFPEVYEQRHPEMQSARDARALDAGIGGTDFTREGELADEPETTPSGTEGEAGADAGGGAGRASSDRSGGISRSSPVTERAAKETEERWDYFVDTYGGGELSFDRNNPGDVEQVRGIVAALQAINSGEEGKKNFLLGDGTGFGKTTQQLIVANEILKNDPDAKVLIVAKSIAKKGNQFDKTFRRDALVMGIDIDQLIADKRLYKASYHGLEKTRQQLADEGVKLRLAIFDESHNMSNSKSNYYEAAAGLEAESHLLASATAATSDYGLTALAFVEGVPYDQLMNDLGAEVFVDSRQREGKGADHDRQFVLHDGVTHKQFIQRVNALVDRIVKGGRYVQRSFDRKAEVEVLPVSRDVKGPKWMKAVEVTEGGRTQKLYPGEVESRLVLGVMELRGKGKDLALNASDALAEFAKVPKIIEEVKAAIEAGQRPLVMLERTSKEPKALKLPDGGTAKIPSALSVLRDQLGKEFSIAEYQGDARGDGAVTWQRGDEQVLLVTYAKGGAGISLDDQGGGGGGQRKMIIATRPKTNWEMDQVYGRVERRGSQSTPVIQLLESDFYSDRNRANNALDGESLFMALRGQTGDATDNVPTNTPSGTRYERHVTEEERGSQILFTVRGFPYSTGQFKDLTKALLDAERDGKAVKFVNSHLVEKDAAPAVREAMNAALDRLYTPKQAEAPPKKQKFVKTQRTPEWAQRQFDNVLEVNSFEERDLTEYDDDGDAIEGTEDSQVIVSVTFRPHNLEQGIGGDKLVGTVRSSIKDIVDEAAEEGEVNSYVGEPEADGQAAPVTLEMSNDVWTEVAESVTGVIHGYYDVTDTPTRGEQKVEEPPKTKPKQNLKDKIDPGGKYVDLAPVGDAISEQLHTGNSMSARDVLRVLGESLGTKHRMKPLVRKLQAALAMDTDLQVEISDDLGENVGGSVDLDANGAPIRIRVSNAAGKAARVKHLLHELVHAATVRNLQHNVTLHQRMERLLSYAKSQLGEQFYGLTSVEEFVAEAYADGNLRTALRGVKTPPFLRQSSFARTLWDSFVQLTRRVLGLPTSERSILDEVMSLEKDLFAKGPTLTESSTPDLVLHDENTAGVVDKIKSFGQDLKDAAQEDVAQTGRTSVKMPLMTTRQIIKRYGNLFVQDGKNLLKTWFDAIAKKAQTTRKYHSRGDRLYQEWTNLSSKDGRAAQELESLMGQSTLYEMWINKDWNHKDNTHLRQKGVKKDGTISYHSNEVVEANKRHFDEMKARFDALPKEFRDMYGKVQEAYTRDWSESVAQIIENVVELYDFGYVTEIKNEKGKIIRREVTQAKDVDKAAFIKDMKANRKMARKVFIPAGDKDVEVDGKSLKNIDHRLSDMVRDQFADLARAGQQRGPYFPLRRFGDHVAVFEKNHKVETFSMDTDEKVITEWRQALRANDRGTQIKEVTKEGDTERKFEVYDRSVQFFESRHEARKAAEEMKKGGWAPRGDKYLMRRKEFFADNQLTGQFLQRAKGRLGSDATKRLENALDAAFIDLLQETSIRKAELRRKGVEGYSTDMRRAFASHTKQHGYYMGALVHGQEIAEAAQAIRDFERDAGRDASVSQGDMDQISSATHEIMEREALDAMDAEDSKLLQYASSAGFLWYLTSASYTLVNATQPAMLGLPWLAARSGDASASAAMRKAYGAISGDILGRGKTGLKSIAKGQKIPSDVFDIITADEQGGLEGTLNERLTKSIMKANFFDNQGVVDMIHELAEKGRIDLTFVADMTAAAEGGGEGQKRFNIFMEWARVMPHLTEVLNRSVMAAAAYDVARQEGKTHEEAVDFADLAVEETQFDYSLANKARYMNQRKSKLLHPVTMFMQHPQHIYYLMGRETIRSIKGFAKLRAHNWDISKLSEAEYAQLKAETKEAGATMLGISAMHMAVGGVAAGIFEPIKWLAGMAISLMGMFDDEPPEDLDKVIRRVLSDVFGKEVGQVMAKGLPTLLGMDVSGRINIGNLLFFDGRPSEDGRDAVQSTVFDLAGPLPAIVGNFAEGIKNFKDGDVLRGVEQMSPKLIRDLVRAGRLSTEGLKDTYGNPIQGQGFLNPVEVFWQGLGFAPSTVSELYAKRGAMKDVEMYYNTKSRRFKERYVRASTRAEKDAVWQDVKDFNKQFPRHKWITLGDLRKSQRLKEKNARRQGDEVMDIRRKDRYLLEYGEPYNA